MSTIIDSDGKLTIDGNVVGPVHACAACLDEVRRLGLPWVATFGECGVAGHPERRAAWEARPWPTWLLDPEDDGSEPWNQS